MCVFYSVKQDVLVAATPSSSAVTSLDMFDISGDGKDELLVGRRDGTVQVFNVPESHDVDNSIRMIYSEVHIGDLMFILLNSSQFGFISSCSKELSREHFQHSGRMRWRHGLQRGGGKYVHWSDLWNDDTVCEDEHKR